MTLAELIQRKAAVLADLDNPDFEGDLDARIAEAQTLATEITKANEVTAQAAEARRALAGATPEQVARTTPTQPEQREAAPVDFAQSFVDHPSLLAYRQNSYAGQVQIAAPMLTVRSLQTRALVDSGGTSGGALQNPARPSVYPQDNADRPVRVADLLDRQSTGNNTVEYVRDTSVIGSGVAAETAEGALKPEATYTFP